MQATAAGHRELIGPRPAATPSRGRLLARFGLLRADHLRYLYDRVMRPGQRTSAIVVATMVALLGACGHAWDELDPRLGDESVASGSSLSASGGSSATSGGTTTGQGASAGASSSANTGGAGGGSANGGAGLVSFFDDFDRADDPGIGNGWIEKTPGAFNLTGNVIVPNGGSGYLNNLVFRASNEALLDVEASVEVELTAANGVPQMFVRVQHATVLTTGVYDGYNLWFPGTNSQANLARQVGSAGSVTLQSLTVSPGLTTGQRYRLRMRAQGTNPVQLAAFVEQWNGNGWMVIGSAMHADSDAARFDTAGAMGFASNNNTAYFYDNFSYTAL